jgi:hypothetical protein
MIGAELDDFTHKMRSGSNGAVRRKFIQVRTRLVPYTEADHLYFFGRRQPRRTIAANLKSSPITTLYGPSGVEKLTRGGVVHDLVESAE